MAKHLLALNSQRMWLGTLCCLLVFSSILSGSGFAYTIASAAPANSPALPASISSRTVVMLELADEPALLAASHTTTRPANGLADPTVARRQIERLSAIQLALTLKLVQTDPTARVIYRLQRVYNGIALEVDSRRLPLLSKLAGVKAIHPLPLKERHNAGAITLVGAPAAWQSYGITGANLKIGIIDSGIDYLHADFGGPGTTAAYNSNNSEVIGDTAGYFPNGLKVINGYDFAGDNYNGSNSPTPDPDPIDCPRTASAQQGHGTHVAATAAGLGVTSAGTTYPGPWNSSLPTNSLKIAPGVAPGASLYALKIFGCDGGTRLAAQAIEWAVDPDGNGDTSDHLDVINLSLGSSYSPPNDPDAVAANNAALAGVAVVASAGNSGDNYYVGGSPANAARVLAVAASEDSLTVADGFQVAAPVAIAGLYPARLATAFNWASPPAGITLPSTRNVFYSATNPTGCTTFSNADKDAINGVGAFVLLDWVFPGEGACSAATGSQERVNNARIAGAKGVVFVFNDTTAEIISIAGDNRIPAIITNKSTGDQLKNYLTPGELDTILSLTLSNLYTSTQKFVVPARTDHLADFSSRESVRENGTAKPDITAPGKTIFSAASGTGSNGYTDNGTSMAAPLVAGAMVLLYQKFPTLSVEQLKARLMNTANHELYSGVNQSGTVYSPARAGSGRLDVLAALSESRLAYLADDSGAVGIAFGPLEITTTTSLTRTVKVVNNEAVAVSYTLSYTSRTATPGVTISFPEGTSLNLPANSQTTFKVRLTANPTLLKNSREATVAAEQEGFPRVWLTEEGGIVNLTPASGYSLRLPLQAVLRSASIMSSTQANLPLPAWRGNSNLTLSGQGLHTGSQYPTDTLSLVSALELVYSNTVAPANPDYANANLKYLGITSDYTAQQALGNPVVSSTLYFGIATHAKWNTPASQSTFKIIIDVDRNGTDDFELVNARRPGTDTFQSFLTPLGGGASKYQDWLNGVSPAQYNTALFNSNVMVIPVKVADLNLGSNLAINYRVESYSLLNFNQTVVDSIASRTYNLSQPGVVFDGANIFGSSTGARLFSDTNAITIPLSYNYGNLLDNGSSGILLLHHHNPGAEAIPLEPPCPNSFNVSSTTDDGTGGCGSLSLAIFWANRQSFSITPVSINVTIPGISELLVTGMLPEIGNLDGRQIVLHGNNVKIKFFSSLTVGLQLQNRVTLLNMRTEMFVSGTNNIFETVLIIKGKQNQIENSRFWYTTGGLRILEGGNVLIKPHTRFNNP